MNKVNRFSKIPPTLNFDTKPLSSSDRRPEGIWLNRDGLATSDINIPPHLRRTIDKSRMPKLAGLLLVMFFVISASCQFFNIVDTTNMEDMDRDMSASYNYNLYYNNTFNNTQRLEQLVQEMSRPNLIEGNPVILPQQITNLADIHIKPDPSEVPFFWHIPRSGGGTIKNIAALCLDLTQASEAGAELNPDSTSLETPFTLVDTITGAKYLNVDSTSIEGLVQAKPKNIAAFPDLDLIVSPYLYDATETLLNNVNRGRMFVMMRHPIDRAVSMYHYMKNRNDIGVQVGDSLLNYAKGNLIENNWMTRFLTNKLGGELTQNDEAIAKEVLRTKSLIGLLKRKNESMERFKQYFGWKIDDSDPKKVECEEKYLEWGWMSKEEGTSSGVHDKLDTDSEEWKILRSANAYDIRLYEYAEKLFEAQGILLDGDHVDYIFEPDLFQEETDQVVQIEEKEETVDDLPDLQGQQDSSTQGIPSSTSDGDVQRVSGADGIASSAPDGEVIDLIASNLINNAP